jgi:large subunit ribosomal protein L10
MPTLEKAQTIEQTKELYSKAVGVVFTDYRGLKVKEIQNLRRNLRDKGAEMHVIKNTLFRIAVGDDVAAMPDDLHNGPTAITFVFENESECTKALFDYAKTNKSLQVKGGYFGGRAFTAKEVEALSNLPSRDVLLAQVIGAIAAPLTSLVGVIEALYADPIRVIGAVADKVGEGAPAPAAAAPAAEAAPAEAEVAPVEAEAAAETPAEAPAEESAAEAEAPAAEDAPAEEASAKAPAEEA